MSDFHPDLARIARFTPRRVITPRTLPLVRAFTRFVSRRTPSDVEALTLPSGVGIRIHRPPNRHEVTPALLFLHGGGLLTGKAGQDDSRLREFAQRLGAIVVGVDYRLIPEHPYPEPLEDCYTALKWLAQLPEVDATRIAVGGGSAGGGLAAALALLARDRGEISLLAQLLVYPMLDDRSGEVSHPDDHLHRLWTRACNRYAWSAYLGDSDPDLVAPGRRQDLTGLPPAWVGVGTADVFHAESLDYAARLRSAGVACELDVVPGAFHGFDWVGAKTPVSVDFFDSQVEFLRNAFAKATAAKA